jgi:hypothetical protein
MSFFGGEVKSEAPYRKILRHVKIPCKYEQKYFSKPNSPFPSPVLSACYQMIAAELWWTNQKSSFVDIIPPWLSMLRPIYHLGMNKKPVCGRSSETVSPSDMIMIISIIIMPALANWLRGVQLLLRH